MGDPGTQIDVLHVDAEPAFLERVGDRLEAQGDRFRVRTATTVEEALEILDASPIDCIVSDYELSRTDGIAFLEAVRESHPELPFILFTGTGSEAVAAEAVSAGVTDYLQKGTATDQFALLANRIENAVSSARAREAARRSRDRFETLSETFPDVAFYVDSEGEYLDVLTGSPGEYLAADPEELIGNRFHEVVPDDTAERFLTVVERTLETGVVQSIEYPLEVPAGQRWFEARVAPLSREERDAVLWVARDITERLDQRERLEQYRQIVETMQDHAAIYDREGTIQVVNESLIEFLDASRDDLEGSPSRLLPRLREEHSSDPLQELLDGDRDELAGEIEIDFGPTPEVIAYRLSPVEVDGDIEWVVAVVRVVTERTEYEHLLRTQQDRFEEFAGVLSHDLRNSLNVAGSRLELATDECESDHLAAIGEAHDRMEEELDSLLMLARGAGYAVAFEPVDVESVARRAWEECRTRAAVLQVVLDDTVMADEESLGRLLAHCFENAVEHGGPDVTVTVGRHPGGFYVEDDGVGVPPDRRERILEPGVSGAEDGSGFGLRIVEEIATAHGWELALEEATAGGLRLVFDEVGFAE